MLTLSFESSAGPASVAVCDGEKLLAQTFQNSKLTHSKTLLVMARNLLSELNLTIHDIELIAVANGPGSFTGVRIGVSVAKGLAWGSDLPVIGVSALEAMSLLLPVPGYLICPVMDARRNEIYNAVFCAESNGIVRKTQDRAIHLDVLANEISDTKTPYMLIGDGAEMCYEYLSKKNISAALAPKASRLQTAYGAALAAIGKPTQPASALEPFYLRKSQAERERNLRLNANPKT